MLTEQSIKTRKKIHKVSRAYENTASDTTVTDTIHKTFVHDNTFRRYLTWSCILILIFEFNEFAKWVRTKEIVLSTKSLLVFVL